MPVISGITGPWSLCALTITWCRRRRAFQAVDHGVHMQKPAASRAALAARPRPRHLVALSPQ